MIPRQLLPLLGLVFAISCMPGAEIGVLACINGNPPALRAVIADARARRIASFVVIGDLCGIGAEPNECIDEIRTLDRLATVAGSWDRHAVGTALLTSPDPDCASVLSWLRRTVTADRKVRLASLTATAVCGHLGYGQLSAPHGGGCSDGLKYGDPLG